MSKIFIDNVEKYGRNYELGLMAKFVLSKRPDLAWKFKDLGLKLFTSGRLPVKPVSVKGQEEIRKITEVLATKEVAQ
jgi:hypothetical protein